MATIKKYDNDLSLGFNRFKSLTIEQKLNLPIVLSNDDADNFIKAIDYLQSMDNNSFKTLLL